MDSITGYDGVEIKAGDRVELHPATDLWMQGARYGTVKEIPEYGLIQIRLDKTGKLHNFSTGNLFRRIEAPASPEVLADIEPQPMGILLAMCEWLIWEFKASPDYVYGLTEQALKRAIREHHEGGVTSFIAYHATKGGK